MSSIQCFPISQSKESCTETKVVNLCSVRINTSVQSVRYTTDQIVNFWPEIESQHFLRNVNRFREFDRSNSCIYSLTDILSVIRFFLTSRLGDTQTSKVL